MNWGNKLLVAFLVFGAGMGYLVYRSVNTNYELVEKDYYKSELRYQQVIDGTNRANGLSGAVKLEQVTEGVRVQLPPEMNHKVVTGDVWFYCAYDKNRDKKFPLQVTPEGNQVFAAAELQPGHYSVKISWNENGDLYFSEQPFTIL